MKRVCFKCNKKIKCTALTIENATSWRTYGNYGSTIFDPVCQNEYLEFYICDNCLKDYAGRVNYIIEHKGISTYTITPFTKKYEEWKR